MIPNIQDDMERYIDRRDRACFFTGHRHIPKLLQQKIAIQLKANVAYLYRNYMVTDFHDGGALGFDTLAAACVLDVKRDNPAVKLILNLPYPSQSDTWKDKDKAVYRHILRHADDIRYASEINPTDKEGARKHLLSRNRAMADSAHFCITYFDGGYGGTSYTVKYAEKVGCEIINLYDEMKKNGLL